MIRHRMLILVLLAVGVVVGGYAAWKGRGKQAVVPPGLARRPVPDGKHPVGFLTPDAVLDAYVQALRDGDVPACKATMTSERLKHDEEYLMGQVKNPADAAAMEKAWRNVMRYYRDAEWREGEFKRFPAEFEGGSRVSLVCVFQNRAKGLKDCFRRYVFVNEGGGWLQSDWVFGEAKSLDPNKYPYQWEKAKQPDKPAATKPARAGNEGD